MMRAAAVIAQLSLLLSACGILPPFPDQEGRSKRIQTLAFGRPIIPDHQLIMYHATPDEQTQRWLYGITPEQSSQLIRRCIRRTDVTAPIQAYRAGRRETMLGCVIWEQRADGAALTIFASPTTFEIHDFGKAEDRFVR